VDKLQGELTNQKERMEEASKLQARLKELKQSKEAAIEAKAMLEDELQSLKHKTLLLSKCCVRGVCHVSKESC